MSSDKNFWGYVSMALAFVLLLGSAGWWFYQKSLLTTYRDAKGIFSVKYLKNWKVVSNPADNPGVLVIFQSPSENALDVFLENVNITTQEVPVQIASLGTFSNTILMQLKAVFKNNITFLVDKDVTFAKRLGHKIIFEAKEPDKLKAIFVWTVKDGKAYIYTFMSRINKFDKLKPYIDESIDSFTLL